MNKLKLGILIVVILISCKKTINNEGLKDSESKKSLIKRIEKQNDFEKTNGILFAKKTKFNYGDVKKGAIVSQKFILCNIGLESVKILEYKSSCNCTNLSISKTVVKPKDSTIVEMMIETKEKHIGRHEVNTVLKTDGKRTFYLLSTKFQVLE